MTNKIITRNSGQTQELGKTLVNDLSGGEVISLIGDLGGGKTTFTQGLAAGLKIADKIVSPTFVILKKYQTEHPEIKHLYHLDLYRINDPQELLDLGFEEIIADLQNLTVVEWADKIPKLIPKKQNLQIKFKWLGKETRKIILQTPSL